METKIITKKVVSQWDVKVQSQSFNGEWRDKAVFRWWHNALSCINLITMQDDRILVNTMHMSQAEVVEVVTKIKRLK